MSALSGAALQRHHALLPQRRRALPDRVWTTLVPLLQVIAQDVNSTGQLSVSVDLRGPLVKDKAGPRLRVAPGVTEQHHLDPWLRVAARLRDGSQLQLETLPRQFPVIM